MNNFGKMTLISTLVILFMSGIIILLLYNYNNTLELKAIYENALEKYEMENSDEKILKEEPSNITYEDFIKLNINGSYDDVIEQLGKPNKKLNANNSYKYDIYTWSTESNASIIISIDRYYNRVQMINEVDLTEEYTEISDENILKVKEGMTVKQVEEILGKGTLIYKERSLSNEFCCEYKYSNGKNYIILGFKEGKLNTINSFDKNFKG